MGDPPSSQDRFRGCLLGLAVGDALGTALEFQSPSTLTPIDDIVGGGPFHLRAGEWTDDTAMALCLAASLLERGGFDPVDQLERYVRWRDRGYMSCTGSCFDIGRTVAAALRRFEATHGPYCGDADPHAAGNGSIMRLAPVVMFHAGIPRKAIDFAAASSRTTHRAREAVDACRYLASLLVGLLGGASTEAVLDEGYEAVPGLWDREPLAPRVARIRRGSFKVRNPPQIRGGGYVIASLEAALWAFWRGASFRDGALVAVNLGDDADTTGAVYGQLAGAAHGMSGIPDAWLAKLAWRDRIRDMADALFEASTRTRHAPA